MFKWLWDSTPKGSEPEGSVYKSPPTSGQRSIRIPRNRGGNGRTRDQEPSPNFPLRAIRDTIVISSATHPADVSVAAAHGLEKRRRQSHSLDATKLKRYTGWRE